MAEATSYLTEAVQALKAAHALGMKGAEGDAAALLVEQALGAVAVAEKVIASKNLPRASAPRP